MKNRLNLKLPDFDLRTQAALTERTSLVTDSLVDLQYLEQRESTKNRVGNKVGDLTEIEKENKRLLRENKMYKEDNVNLVLQLEETNKFIKVWLT